MPFDVARVQPTKPPEPNPSSDRLGKKLSLSTKVADIYTHPAGLREELQGSLGTFPLHRFWGPGTSIESSKWTADAAVQVDKEHDPTLTLIYLPHLDYSLQKYGPPPPPPSPLSDGGGGGKGGSSPDDPDGRVLKDLKEIDGVLEGLVSYYESDAVGARVVILSEYAISRVERPVYLNRVLRAEGLVQVRTENGGETLDCGECRAFALCDHQVCVCVCVCFIYYRKVQVSHARLEEGAVPFFLYLVSSSWYLCLYVLLLVGHTGEWPRRNYSQKFDVWKK